MVATAAAFAPTLNGDAVVAADTVPMAIAAEADSAVQVAVIQKLVIFLAEVAEADSAVQVAMAAAELNLVPLMKLICVARMATHQLGVAVAVILAMATVADMLAAMVAMV